MKQLFLRKGDIVVEEVPAPALPPGNVLVEVRRSLISTGTEMSTVNLSSASLLQKAAARPKEVQKVWESVRVRGVKKTLALVKDKLDETKALGYSCAGTVIAVGSAVKGFRVGDRVACAGAGLANHAEVVSVPTNLVVRTPDALSDSQAAFVTLGAIALQGVRRAEVALGETVAVIGLGLLGQLTVQLLAAAGCTVVGVDPDETRVERAKTLGLKWGGASADDLAASLGELTSGMGVDATILTASTDSSDPANAAFAITRKKGRIVVVGAVGMELQRSPFYEKEQDFVISCSYGPGRYDPAYEQQGVDYPYAFVRWTENRNMSAFLSLVTDKRVDVLALIDREFSVEDAGEAYAVLSDPGPKPLAIVLAYPVAADKTKKASGVSRNESSIASPGLLRLGLIGVGGFTRSVHIPTIRDLEERIKVTAVCAATSASAQTVARQVGASLVATDYRAVISDANVDAVLIATRHNTHAEIAAAALRAGKHVYLEKPMALTDEEVNDLKAALETFGSPPVFMVGYNRRFAPLAQELQTALRGRTSPLVVVYRVNAGEVPAGHWTQGEEGGGRLRGEACHMIDFFQFLTGAPLRSAAIAAAPAGGAHRPDENFSIVFEFEDGSVATLVYTSLGSPEIPKEWMEAHWNGRTAVLDDFKRLTITGAAELGVKGPQDKGHADAFARFVTAIRDRIAAPIPWAQLEESARTAIALDRAAWRGSEAS